MKKMQLIFCLVLSSFTFGQNDTITLVSYNLLNFPDGRNDCGSGNVNPANRADTLRKVMQYIKPDIFVGCEIQTEAGADSVLTRTLNVFGATNYLMAPFIYSNGGGGSLNNAMYYNSDKLTFLRQNPILTSSRDINHYTLMVNDPNIAQHRDTIFVEVHMAHLKAGSGSTNSATRATQTQLFRTYVESKPQGRNHFFCGDLNVYSSSEQGYQNLITGGNNPFVDPIASPGSWNNSSSYAGIHTQSTRSSGSSWACGSTGGMDDRFDQILVTQNVMSGTHNLSYVTNSYDAVGNDGQHYNTGLLNGTNTQYPDSVVRALFYMSDHLPVVLKMVPTLPTTNGLGLTYTQNGPLCGGSSNGTATVAPLYGVAPYTVQWDANAGNQTSLTASNLSSGSYCVTVTDANGLTDEVCFEILSVPGLSASAFPNVSTGNCDGSAAVLVSGGSPNYTFSWNDPMNQTAQTATNLCPGNYVCTVGDQGNCTLDVQVSIIEVLGLLEQAAENQDLQIAPNPFDDEVKIWNKGAQDLAFDQIILRDIQGKVVLSKTVELLQKESFIGLKTSQLNSGVYFLEIANKESKIHFKMVK